MHTYNIELFPFYFKSSQKLGVKSIIKEEKDHVTLKVSDPNFHLQALYKNSYVQRFAKVLLYLESSFTTNIWSKLV